MKSDSEKIKNAIRIIDFRIENCLEQKREMVRAKFNPEVLEMGNSLMEKMVKNFQEIRDELRPKKKSIMNDKEKLEAIQKIFHECTALDHSLVRAERFLTADGQSEIRETQKKAFQKIKDIVES